MSKNCSNCGEERYWYDGKTFRCYRCDSPVEPKQMDDKNALQELESYQEAFPMHFYDANVLSGETVFLAIQALKKRIATKPNRDRDDGSYLCPSCGELLDGGQYCSDCGKKIDLS